MKITSRKNPLIKRYRAFKDKYPSRQEEYFCLEGTHLLDEFLKLGEQPENIIVTEDWFNKNNSLIKNVNFNLINIVSNEVLTSALSTKNPDGVAALVRNSSIPKFNFDESDDFVLVLDRVQDPGNLGNILRTALAGDVDKIILGGGAHPLGQKTMRASCGALFHLPFKRIAGKDSEVVNHLLEILDLLSKKGFQIISTTSKKLLDGKEAKPYWEIDWSKRTVLILGNEGSGIHKKIKEAFNETITIPHNELVESLNVACVAVPLILERKRVTFNLGSKKQK